MNEKKLRSAMGFAMKAGKCAAGDFQVEKLIKTGKAKVALIDAAASDNTKERYRGMCERAAIPLIELEHMADSIGKYGRMVAATDDAGFAAMIASAYTEAELN